MCGGRFNRAFSIMSRFFAELYRMKFKLIFFIRDRSLNFKYNIFYKCFTDMTDTVDEGLDLQTLVNYSTCPRNYDYVIKQLGKMYGTVIITVDADFSVQELVAYANSVEAFAIMSNTTSFLLYEGNWRLWSSKDIDMENLICKEYNRKALMQTLGLSYRQMAFFSTISGCYKLLPYEEIKRFRSQLGILGMANFVREHYSALNKPRELQAIVSIIYYRSHVNRQMVETFRRSLMYHTTESIPNRNPTKDHVIDTLLALDHSLPYKIWTRQNCNIITYFIDMRLPELGKQFPQLIIPIFQRLAGIVLFHKRNQRQIYDGRDVILVIKIDHLAEHQEKTVTAQFPEDITPPPLLDLYSSDPILCVNLYSTKLQLYCWVVSNGLEHGVLETIPERLRVTVSTIFFLMENHILKLFEADLLLQVAFDVMHETFDHETIKYPSRLDSRAFHVVFVYQEFYNHFSEAVKLVGLAGKDFRNYPPPICRVEGTRR
ncbi:uncharacterized protein LOC129729793 [Wyeomyia smithii]|uniref:uncharacterized protein LOC129729793 n=1 Tax=Wyeomyia smithii TaxID=174621 RepID=UPI002467C805|nr:uncharacterized protein LOC129729793 [Wyeomyia smithii]